MTTAQRVDGISRRHALGGLAALTVGATVGPVRGQQLIKSTLAYGSTGYTWASTFLAEALDAWRQNGVDLSVVDFPTGRESMQALLAGSADFSTSTDTPFVFAALQGLKPVVLLNYSRYTHDMKIVVRKDGSVDPNAPASLKGKKVATRVGTSGQYMLARYLEMSGQNLRDVTVIDLSPNDMTVALTRGDIDAFAWTGQAALVGERQSGGKTVTMKQDGLERLFQSHQLLLTSDKVIREKPQLIAAAARAIFAAEDHMKKELAWHGRIAPRVKASAEEIRDMTAAFQFEINFNQRFLYDIVAHAEWAIQVGIARKPSQDLRALFRGLIYDKTVRELRPDRVTLPAA
ncbi:MAG: ABC transporter substrate-binding protein [Alphaproteobacteria bacterium]|nr:ABC transporter substrate-binding protein [Alphaproteobacteria bacterium]